MVLTQQVILIQHWRMNLANTSRYLTTVDNNGPRRVPCIARHQPPDYDRNPVHSVARITRCGDDMKLKHPLYKKLQKAEPLLSSASCMHTTLLHQFQHHQTAIVD